MMKYQDFTFWFCNVTFGTNHSLGKVLARPGQMWTHRILKLWTQLVVEMTFRKFCLVDTLHEDTDQLW